MSTTDKNAINYTKEQATASDEQRSFKKPSTYSYRWNVEDILQKNYSSWKIKRGSQRTSTK